MNQWLAVLTAAVAGVALGISIAVLVRPAAPRELVIRQGDNRWCIDLDKREAVICPWLSEAGDRTR